MAAKKQHLRTYAIITDGENYEIARVYKQQYSIIDPQTGKCKKDPKVEDASKVEREDLVDLWNPVELVVGKNYKEVSVELVRLLGTYRTGLESKIMFENLLSVMNLSEEGKAETFQQFKDLLECLKKVQKSIKGSGILLALSGVLRTCFYDLEGVHKPYRFLQLSAPLAGLYGFTIRNLTDLSYDDRDGLYKESQEPLSDYVVMHRNPEGGTDVIKIVSGQSKKNACKSSQDPKKTEP